MQEVSELRLEITHDARTRKIRPGSDLRHDVRYIYILYRKFTANSSMWGSLRLAPILDECRTLWGEPERVHAGTECAWSSCMCMSSECESDGELRTQTQITPEEVMTALIIDFVHLKQSGR